MRKFLNFARSLESRFALSFNLKGITGHKSDPSFSNLNKSTIPSIRLNKNNTNKQKYTAHAWTQIYNSNVLASRFSNGDWPIVTNRQTSKTTPPAEEARGGYPTLASND